MDYEARVESVLFCAICQEERLHIGHGCTDGHEADCPERLCVECGFAVIVSDVLVDEVRLVHASVA
jgi:hypothetical protein